ncbi:hypothetical protein GEMRC1_011858 [Eukaryota sp. GEM-RC1]
MIKSLNEQLSDMSRHQSELQTHVDHLQSDSLSLTSKLADADALNCKLNNQNQTLQSQLTSVKSNLEEAEANLNKENKNLKKQISTLEDENVLYKDTIKEANVRLIGYSDGLNRVRFERGEVRSRVAELEKEVAQNEIKINELGDLLKTQQAKNSEQETEIFTLRSKVQKLEDHAQSQQQAITWYSKELGKLDQPNQGQSSTSPIRTSRTRSVFGVPLHLEENESPSKSPKYSFNPTSLELSLNSAKYRPRRMVRSDS